MCDSRFETTCDIRFETMCDIRFEAMCDSRFETMCDIPFETMCDIPFETMCDIRFETMCDIRFETKYKGVLNHMQTLNQTLNQGPTPSWRLHPVGQTISSQRAKGPRRTPHCCPKARTSFCCLDIEASFG